MKKFHCVIPGAGIKTFAKAVHCLAKIGEELFLEAGPDSLSLKTVNGGRSAYACFNLKRSFFYSYHVKYTNRDKEQSELLSIKLLLKSFVSMFRSPATLERSVDHCNVSLDSEATKIVFVLHCKHGIVKTHQYSYQDCDELQAVFSKDLCPNTITGAERSFSEVVVNYPASLEEVIVSVVSDRLTLRNYTEDNDQRVPVTAVFLHPQEFSSYQIDVDTSITFSLKELRAILGFTESLNFPLSVRFETAGKPVVFSVDKGATEFCTADFVLATFMDSPSMVSGHSSVGTAPSSDGTAVASTPFSKTVNTGVSDAEQPHDTYSQSSSFAVPLSRAPPRTALEHQDSGGMCGGADRTHPVSQLREQFSQQTCSPPPHELMEELFESDNSDHVMDVGTKTDTSLSDDQFFKDFPHQDSSVCRAQPGTPIKPVSSLRQTHSQVIEQEDSGAAHSVMDSSGCLPSTPPPKKFKSVFSGVDIFGIHEDNLTVLAPDSESEED